MEVAFDLYTQPESVLCAIQTTLVIKVEHSSLVIIFAQRGTTSDSPIVGLSLSCH